MQAHLGLIPMNSLEIKQAAIMNVNTSHPKHKIRVIF